MLVEPQSKWRITVHGHQLPVLMEETGVSWGLHLTNCDTVQGSFTKATEWMPLSWLCLDHKQLSFNNCWPSNDRSQSGNRNLSHCCHMLCNSYGDYGSFETSNTCGYNLLTGCLQFTRGHSTACELELVICNNNNISGWWPTFISVYTGTNTIQTNMLTQALPLHTVNRNEANNL